MTLLLRGGTSREYIFEEVFDSGSEFLESDTNLLEKTSLVLLITSAIGVVSSALLRAAIVVPTLETSLSALCLLAPIAEDEPSKEHSSEVGKVGYVAVGGKGRVGFDESISNDEVFGFHRDGRDEQHDALVGESHPKSQEYTIACTTGTDGDPLIEITAHGHNHAIDIGSIIFCHSCEIVFSKLPQLLTESSTNTTDEIVDNEAFLPHGLLNDASEHPQTKHVEQDVTPRSMEKHVGEWLVDAKIRG